MGRYRSRSRSLSPSRRGSRSPPPPTRRKHYDEPPRDRYRGGGGGGGGRSYRDYGRSSPPTGLLIRNISLGARPEDLRIPFERFGPVKDVYLPKNYYTGEPRGFGFVKYRNAEDAAEAKHQMNHQVIGGREITIVYAEENRKTPQEMRTVPRSSGRYGGGSRRRTPPRSPRRQRRSYSFSPSPPRRESSMCSQIDVAGLVELNYISAKLALAIQTFRFWIVQGSEVPNKIVKTRFSWCYVFELCIKCRDRNHQERDYSPQRSISRSPSPRDEKFRSDSRSPSPRGKAPMRSPSPRGNNRSPIRSPSPMAANRTSMRSPSPRERVPGSARSLSPRGKSRSPTRSDTYRMLTAHITHSFFMSYCVALADDVSLSALPTDGSSIVRVTMKKICNITGQVKAMQFFDHLLRL
ncbi:hypothetical protein IFM89_015895 [Coptis chinensis]|uniref:RRM domain-containing protein n=1 Tax=Coptis chinensis TaxID=261450 RepID=A0A835HTX3_9MAGN|nr:hypothetical protein IFM89_015895 [Coptis chinensis]